MRLAWHERQATLLGVATAERPVHKLTARLAKEEFACARKCRAALLCQCGELSQTHAWNLPAKIETLYRASRDAGASTFGDSCRRLIADLDSLDPGEDCLDSLAEKFLETEVDSPLIEPLGQLVTGVLTPEGLKLFRIGCKLEELLCPANVHQFLQHNGRHWEPDVQYDSQSILRDRYSSGDGGRYGLPACVRVSPGNIEPRGAALDQLAALVNGFGPMNVSQLLEARRSAAPKFSSPAQLREFVQQVHDAFVVCSDDTQRKNCEPSGPTTVYRWLNWSLDRSQLMDQQGHCVDLSAGQECFALQALFRAKGEIVEHSQLKLCENMTHQRLYQVINKLNEKLPKVRLSICGQRGEGYALQRESGSTAIDSSETVGS